MSSFTWTPTGEPNAQEAELIEEEIRHRAHELSQSDEAGTHEENWLRAEREMRERGSGG